MGDLRRMVAGLAVMAIAGLALATGAAEAAKFKVLHSFCTPGHRFCGDGSNPPGQLVMDQAGNFFGTAATGGLDAGTVFELERKPGGRFKFKTLYRFCTQGTCGHNPSGAPVIDTQGNLYGTASNLVFELSRGGKRGLWTEKVIHSFCGGCGDGNLPNGGLTYAGASSGVPYDGVSPLFGVTQLGGANNGGTVFELTNNGGGWTETVLYSFCSQGGSNCTDGEHPLAPPTIDPFGNLFGTALDGGNKFSPFGAGAIYELTLSGSSWTETVLHRFCSLSKCADGARPLGKLAMDSSGALFGIAQNGGHCTLDKEGCGVLFKLLPNGEQSEETLLHVFCSEKDCRDGDLPQGGPLLDSSGDLFGSTAFGGGNDIDQRGFGGGVVYELASDASFRVLHSFCSLSDCADGEDPESELVMDALGRLYATTELGGDFGEGSAGGTVFRVNP